MKIISFIVVSILQIGCMCENSKNKIVPHTRMSFIYSENKGNDEVFRVWSFEKLHNQGLLSHVKIEGDLGNEYFFEKGAKLKVTTKEVIINGESHGHLFGNYILSGQKLEPGFIRSFD